MRERKPQTYSIITTIQQNLKQMQQQAQQYLDKHHVNLPSICTARHYLFHTIGGNDGGGSGGGGGNGEKEGKDGKDGGNRGIGKGKIGEKEVENIGVLISRNNGKIKNKLKQAESEIQTQGEQRNKTLDRKRTSVYNLEFTKKTKQNQYDRNRQRMPSMNSTSLRLKMSGSWKTSRYIDNVSSRSSLQPITNTDKMKTIMLNSEIIDLAQKDLQMTNTTNTNKFSPKISSKLNLNKKQTDILQKYFSRFKQYQSSQINQHQHQQHNNIESPSKLSQLVNKSTQLLPKQILTQSELIKRRRKRLCRIGKDGINGKDGKNEGEDDSVGKYQSGKSRRRRRDRFQLESELLGGKRKLGKIIVDKGGDGQEQCTPWDVGEKREELAMLGENGLDFS